MQISIHSAWYPKEPVASYHMLTNLFKEVDLNNIN